MLPVQITIRDLPASATLESHVRKRASKLKQFYDRISSCRIVLEHQKKHQNRGKLYNIRIDVTVPGKELVTTRKSDSDIYIAIRDSFKAIERQLEEHSRKRHGRVKTHNHTLRGVVVRVFPHLGYGFIEGIDGHEYYFSVTNVNNLSFEQLLIGDPVEFISETVNDGRQAHHVLKMRHNHLAA